VNEPPDPRRATSMLVLGIIVAALLATQSIVFVWFAVSHLEPAESLDPTFASDEPLLRERRVLLFHDVNSHTAKDVSARLMHLNAIDPGTPIDLYISTQGGWSDNAFTIIDTMRTISAPVNTWAIGGCYSAGALILAAATGRRYATENSILMIHTNLDDSKEAYSYARLARERYERVYKEKTTLPAAWYPMTDDRRHYLSPQEALEFRLVDEVVPVWGRAGGK